MEVETIYRFKSMVLSILGRKEEALECCDMVLQKDPINYPDVWELKAEILFLKFRKYDEALECFDKALEIDSEYAPALFNRAYVKIIKGLVDDGLLDLENAIKLNPEFLEEAKEEFRDLIRENQRFRTFFEELQLWYNENVKNNTNDTM